MNSFGHGWGMGYGWFIPLLFLALLFYMIQDKKRSKSSAQEILDKRYANGEIDKTKYLEKSKQLKEG